MMQNANLDKALDKIALASAIIITISAAGMGKDALEQPTNFSVTAETNAQLLALANELLIDASELLNTLFDGGK